MAGEDEYELLPRQEVENLKKEIERLKKHPFGETEEGETLVEAINNLNANIKKLVDLFTKVEADMAKEYSESSPAEALDTIRSQNEEIAQGVVAVADLIKEMKEQEKPLSHEPKIPIGRGIMHPPAPEPFPEEPSHTPFPPEPPPDIGVPKRPSLPPLPEDFPPMKKRKGLFSRK